MNVNLLLWAVINYDAKITILTFSTFNINWSWRSQMLTKWMYITIFNYHRDSGIWYPSFFPYDCKASKFIYTNDRKKKTWPHVNFLCVSLLKYRWNFPSGPSEKSSQNPLNIYLFLNQQFDTERGILWENISYYRTYKLNIIADKIKNKN